MSRKHVVLATLIGTRLIRLCVERDWPRQEVSRRTGISTSALAQYETGKICPNAYYLWKLSQAFDVTMDSWFKHYDDERGAT